MSPSFRKVFPSNNPHLNNGDLVLLEKLRARINVFKVLLTSLNPNKINNEAMQKV
jgi:hypothetical protein